MRSSRHLQPGGGASALSGQLAQLVQGGQLATQVRPRSVRLEHFGERCGGARLHTELTYRARQVAPIGRRRGLPDGRILATASADRTVQPWNAANPARLAPLTTICTHSLDVNSVAFSPDGRLIATGSTDETARVWDVTRPDRPVMLATASDDRTVRLWTVASRDLWAILRGHRQPLRDVAATAGRPWSPPRRTVRPSSAARIRQRPSDGSAEDVAMRSPYGSGASTFPTSVTPIPAAGERHMRMCLWQHFIT